MKFTKIQAAGNDYILVETSDDNRDWSRTAVAVLDRHYGIGADGLLLMMPSESGDLRMRIFNVDGSESEACGNGLRCMVKYYIDKAGGTAAKGEISVETIAGIRKAAIGKSDGKTTIIESGMGVPEFGEEDIPGRGTRFS